MHMQSQIYKPGQGLILVSLVMRMVAAVTLYKVPCQQCPMQMSKFLCLWAQLVNKTEYFSRLLTIWAHEECCRQQIFLLKIFTEHQNIRHSHTDTKSFCYVCNHTLTQLLRTLKQMTFGITTFSEQEEVFDFLRKWVLSSNKCTEKNEMKFNV